MMGLGLTHLHLIVCQQLRQLRQQLLHTGGGAENTRQHWQLLSGGDADLPGRGMCVSGTRTAAVAVPDAVKYLSPLNNRHCHRGSVVDASCSTWHSCLWRCTLWLLECLEFAAGCCCNTHLR